MKEEIVTWVVYQMTINKKPEGMKAVCEQSEWEELERAKPGYHHFIRGGIASEVEAEKFARGDPTAGTSSATWKAKHR